MNTRTTADESAPPAGRAGTPVRLRARRRLTAAGRARSTALLSAASTRLRPVGPLDCADPGTMVGRQPELSRLRALWDETAKGKAATRLILVAGEPGVGKTKLAAELAGVVETLGGRVLVGRCGKEAATPYEPFLEALAPALAERPDSWLRAHVKRQGPALTYLFPEVARRLGEVSLDPHHGPRPRFLDAVAAAIGSLGDEPVLLVIEDLHRATPSTVNLLDRVMQGRKARILIVGTYRDAAIHPSHPLAGFLDNPSSGRMERLFLANLSPQAITALLVDRAAVAGKSAAALAQALWQATEGNPLVLTEVVGELTAAGALAGGSVAPSVVDKVGVARTITEIVNRRLGRPASRARGFAEVAAVVGPTFPDEILADLVDCKEDAARSALAKVVAAGIVAPVAGEPGRYRFVHDLFHDAVYETLPPNRRVYLHQRVAELLEQLATTSPVPATVLLHHRAASTPVGRSTEAVEHARRSGDEAMRILAFEEAAEFYGKALAFLGPIENGPPRADLLLLLAEANRMAGESARARQSYLQAAAAARAAGDGPRLGRAVLGLGEVISVWGADALLIGLLDQAVALNPEDPALRAKLMGRLAQARAAFDSPDERKERSDRAWELAWDSRDADTMGSVLRARHEALSAPDDLEDRVEIDGELYAMASSAGDPDLAIQAHGWRLVDLLEQGHIGDADRDRKIHAQLARRSHDSRHQRDAAMWAATWALMEGRPRRASTQIDRALALGQEIQDPSAPSHYWIQQLALLVEWGSDAELEGLVEVWRDLVRTHDRAPYWRASLALLLAVTGRPDEARAEIDDVLVDDCADLPQDREWLPTVACVGEAAALVGDERAVALARLLSPYSRRMVVLGLGAACRGSVARVTGLLWAAAGRWTESERSFQAALSAHERASTGPLLARTRADFARSLAAKPGGKLHVGRAGTTLGQAIEEADRFGMTRLAADTRTTLAGLPRL